MKEGQVGGDAAHFTVLKSLAEGWDGRFPRWSPHQNLRQHGIVGGGYGEPRADPAINAHRGAVRGVR